MKPTLKIIQNTGPVTPSFYHKDPSPKLVLVHSGTTPMRAAALEVIVTNIKDSRGQIMLALYDSKETFMKRVNIGTGKPAHKGEVRFSFPDLPQGDYAIVVYHDINRNGRLDTNMLGMPVEPWAVSTQGKATIGTPGWTDAHFTVPGNGISLTMPLK